MENAEHLGRVFVVVVTTIALAIIGLWLAWIVATERWSWLAGYYLLMAALVVRFWDYRDD